MTPFSSNNYIRYLEFCFQNQVNDLIFFETEPQWIFYAVMFNQHGECVISLHSFQVYHKLCLLWQSDSADVNYDAYVGKVLKKSNRKMQVVSAHKPMN